jgi:hypothetical protein
MSDVVGAANARRVWNVKSQTFESTSFMQFVALANILVEGPSTISVIHSADEPKYVYDQVLTILIRSVVQGHLVLASWAIYRPEQKYDPAKPSLGFVLRRAYWNSGKDRLAHHSGARTPTVLIMTRHVSEHWYVQLDQGLLALDTVLVSGVRFDLRNTESEWRDIKVRRVLDFGSIELCWDNEKQNISCENAIFALKESIDSLLNHHQSVSLDDVEEMEFVYHSIDAMSKYLMFAEEM